MWKVSKLGLIGLRVCLKCFTSLSICLNELDRSMEKIPCLCCLLVDSSKMINTLVTLLVLWVVFLQNQLIPPMTTMLVILYIEVLWNIISYPDPHKYLYKLMRRSWKVEFECFRKFVIFVLTEQITLNRKSNYFLYATFSICFGSILFKLSFLCVWCFICLSSIIK